MHNSYEERIKSFKETFGFSKKTGKRLKSKKAVWPHTNPSPSDLALAGFSFNPTPTANDNVTCFICKQSLDGWQESDDPIKEHFALSPDCPWAIIKSKSWQLENAAYNDYISSTNQNHLQSMENNNNNNNNNNDNILPHIPTSEKAIQIRLATFTCANWPHESKRGWLPTSKNMAAAGFYYNPDNLADEDQPTDIDYVSCQYCDLGLDGWEPRDDPIQEHKKRNPNCYFFSYNSHFPSLFGSTSTSTLNSNTETNLASGTVKSRKRSSAATNHSSRKRTSTASSKNNISSLSPSSSSFPQPPLSQSSLSPLSSFKETQPTSPLLETKSKRLSRKKKSTKPTKLSVKLSTKSLASAQPTQTSNTKLLQKKRGRKPSKMTQCASSTQNTILTNSHEQTLSNQNPSNSSQLISEIDSNTVNPPNLISPTPLKQLEIIDTKEKIGPVKNTETTESSVKKIYIKLKNPKDNMTSFKKEPITDDINSENSSSEAIHADSITETSSKTISCDHIQEPVLQISDQTSNIKIPDNILPNDSRFEDNKILIDNLPSHNLHNQLNDEQIDEQNDERSNIIVNHSINEHRVSIDSVEKTTDRRSNKLNTLQNEDSQFVYISKELPLENQIIMTDSLANNSNKYEEISSNSAKLEKKTMESTSNNSTNEKTINECPNEALKKTESKAKPISNDNPISLPDSKLTHMFTASPIPPAQSLNLSNYKGVSTNESHESDLDKAVLELKATVFPSVCTKVLSASDIFTDSNNTDVIKEDKIITNVNLKDVINKDLAKKAVNKKEIAKKDIKKKDFTKKNPKKNDIDYNVDKEVNKKYVSKKDLSKEDVNKEGDINMEEVNIKAANIEDITTQDTNTENFIKKDINTSDVSKKDDTTRNITKEKFKPTPKPNRSILGEISNNITPNPLGNKSIKSSFQKPTTNQDWEDIPLDIVFQNTTAEFAVPANLSNLTIAQWIEYNAIESEKVLAQQCNNMVNILLSNGEKAIKYLESLPTID